jgi:hypothetical protein
MVPMTDSEWATLLEEVGLTPRTRGAPHGLPAWHWCPTCRAVVRVRAARWWPSSLATEGFQLGSSARDAAPLSNASATEVEP